MSTPLDQLLTLWRLRERRYEIAVAKRKTALAAAAAAALSLQHRHRTLAEALANRRIALGARLEQGENVQTLRLERRFQLDLRAQVQRAVLDLDERVLQKNGAQLELQARQLELRRVLAKQKFVRKRAA